MNSTARNGDENLSLLLLPEPPSEVSTVTMRAAYEPALSQALKVLSSRSTDERRAKFDIGVTCAVSIDARNGGPREEIDLVYGNDVDVRVILIAGDATSSTTQGESNASISGPLIDIGTLALSQRPWSDVYAVESEEGEFLLNRFLAGRVDTALTTRIPYSFRIGRLTGGPIIRRATNPQAVGVAGDSNVKRHLSIAVGGTFDHLHAGHKLLLTATALLLEPINNSQHLRERCLTIGITGDELLKNKKYAEELESWDLRQAAVCQFLLDIIHFGEPGKGIQDSEQYFHEGPNGRAIHYKLECGMVIRCVAISDPFGPTITDEAITALVVSGETRAGGKAVNDRRREKGWPELDVFEVDVLDMSAQDETASPTHDQYQSKISSTEIRRRLHDKKKGSV